MIWEDIRQDYAAEAAACARRMRRLRRCERESRGAERRMYRRCRMALRPRWEKLRALAEISGQTIPKGGVSYGAR